MEKKRGMEMKEKILDFIISYIEIQEERVIWDISVIAYMIVNSLRKQAF